MTDEHENVYRITVDYGMSLDEMAKAGNYCYPAVEFFPDEYDSEHFSVTGEGVHELDAILLHVEEMRMLQRPYYPLRTLEEIVARLDVMGLRAATLAEFLAFGAMYPDVQCDYSVICVDAGSRKKTYRGPGHAIPWLYHETEGWTEDDMEVKRKLGIRIWDETIAGFETDAVLGIDEDMLYQTRF